MVEKLTAVAAVIGAATAIVAAVGVLIVNGKLDRLTGRVDGNTAAITTRSYPPHPEGATNEPRMNHITTE